VYALTPVQVCQALSTAMQLDRQVRWPAYASARSRRFRPEPAGPLPWLAHLRDRPATHDEINAHTEQITAPTTLAAPI
jgi:hypothetical protein